MHPLRFIHNHIWVGLPKPAEVTWRLRRIAAPSWGGILIALGVWFAYKGWRKQGEPFLNAELLYWTVAGLMLAAAVLTPRLGGIVYVAVMRGFALVGFVVSNFIMAVFFYVFVTPMALVMRLAGRDPLDERGRPRPVWHAHTTPNERRRYYRMF